MKDLSLPVAPAVEDRVEGGGDSEQHAERGAVHAGRHHLREAPTTAEQLTRRQHAGHHAHPVRHHVGYMFYLRTPTEQQY